MHTLHDLHVPGAVRLSGKVRVGSSERNDTGRRWYELVQSELARPWTLRGLARFARRAPSRVWRRVRARTALLRTRLEWLPDRTRQLTLRLLHADEARGPLLEPIVLRTPGDVDVLLDFSTNVELPLHLVVEDLLTLRSLTVPRPREICVHEDFRLEVRNWVPPHATWRGATNPLAATEYVSVEADPGRKVIKFHVRLREPKALAKIIAALYPAVAPIRPTEGAGVPHVVVAPGISVQVLSLLPTTLARTAHTTPEALGGVGLPASDVILVPGNLGNLREGIAFSEIPVNAHGELARTQSRLAKRARVDIHAHNPVGRLPNFHESKRRWSAAFVGGMLRLEGVSLIGDDPYIIDVDPAVPLPGPAARALHTAVSVDVSSLEAPADDTVRHDLLNRLVEISMCGVVVRGLRVPQLWNFDDFVDSALVDDFASDSEVGVGLRRDQSSVRQRRLILDRHSGIGELESHIEERTGWSIRPVVSAIICTKRPERLAGVVRLMAEQDYPSTEIVVVAHGFSVKVARDAVRQAQAANCVVVAASATDAFGQALATGLRASSGDLIVKIDDDDWYSRHAVSDLVWAHRYSGADVVGKTTEYLYLDRVGQTVHRAFATERYHSQVAGGAMLLSRSVLDAIGGWRPTPNSTDRSILLRVHESGGVAYRTHGLGYLYVRHSDAHTWVRSDSHLLSGSFEQWKGQVLPEVSP